MAAGLIILAHTITAAYVGVAPDSVKPIKAAYTMSPEEFISFAGYKPPIRGIYRKSEEKIYLAVKEYYKDRFIFSQLLHETVHHFQREANIDRSTSRSCEEFEAQTLQAIYLKSKGADWVDDVFEAQAKEINHGKCN